ncbi:MAG: hypothetical protein NVV59_08055, partial [Chitinophagaceae bacterium]|nr:hypothetical protein [Chitinophagaceae bacterium]
MYKLRLIAVLVLVFVGNESFAQKLKKADKVTLENLKAHIGYLADDKLEGRRAGSAGEKLAMEYISTHFAKLGIAPKGVNGYYQPFEIHEGKKLADGSYVSINGINLTDKEYLALPYSAEKFLEATPAVALQEADMPWFVDLKEILEENKTNPHFDIHDYIKKNTQRAFDKGATSVLLFNTSDIDDK